MSTTNTTASADLGMKIVQLIEVMGWQRIADDVRDGATSPERALEFLSKCPLNKREFRTIARAAYLVYTGQGTIDIDTLRDSLDHTKTGICSKCGKANLNAEMSSWCPSCAADIPF